MGNEPMFLSIVIRENIGFENITCEYVTIVNM